MSLLKRHAAENPRIDKTRLRLEVIQPEPEVKAVRKRTPRTVPV